MSPLRTTLFTTARQGYIHHVGFDSATSAAGTVHHAGTGRSLWQAKKSWG
ncbi:hypothetical protein FrEUN1fDRAFT_7004 [Parafrankia sp. EUN1f]|nr:hypothetical protein FrEUN1fDRAFT_7004 [Parafrankia sp. EUN1f]